MKSSGICAAVCVFAVLTASAPAGAANDTSCFDSTRTDDKLLNLGYDRCAGPFGGQLGSAMALTELQRVYNFTKWSLLGLSNDAGFGPFSSNPQGLAEGTLLLDTPRADLFVIGLQAIGEFAFYLFDYTGKEPTASIAFDTLGIDNLLSPGEPLERAAVYQPTVVPPPPGSGVPEPATWALALAGLCALAAHRRDRAA